MSTKKRKQDGWRRSPGRPPYYHKDGYQIREEHLHAWRVRKPNGGDHHRTLPTLTEAKAWAFLHQQRQQQEQSNEL